MPRKANDIVLTLICTAETTWEADARLRGSADVPLSAAGRAALTTAVANLPWSTVATVHHPPGEASTETAQLVARRDGAKTRAVEELSDPDLGLLGGMSNKEFADRYPRRYKQWQEDPLSVVPPEGESLAEARERIFLTCSRLLSKSREGPPAIVVHPIGFGLLQCWLANQPATNLWSYVPARRILQRYLLPESVVDLLHDAAQGAAQTA